MDRPSSWVVGRVHTGRRKAEAFVVENGRVVSVGTRRSTRRDRPTGAERLEVRSGLILPGLVDAHVHPVHVALNARGVDLWGIRSIDDLVERTRAWGEGHASGIILGRGWDQELLREHRFPTVRDLDRLRTDRPVILFRTCSHVALLNRPALDQMDILKTEEDPRGGRIGRDDRGEPDGLLFEEALRPVSAAVTEEILRWKGAVDDVLQGAVRLGLTTIAPMSASPAELRWGFERARKRQLPVRLRSYAGLRFLSELQSLKHESQPDWAALTGAKAVLDGSFGARTAHLRAPYTDRPDDRGIALWDPKELQGAIQSVWSSGLGVALHAIGDAALEGILTFLEPLKHRGAVRIEHASLTPPDLLARLSAVRPDLVVQPGFVLQDTWIAERLGPARARWTYPFASFLNGSLRVAGSSDAPVDSLDPIRGIRAAVHRAPFRRQFERSPPDERLTWAEALRLYTTSAGEVLGDSGIGTLERGGYGDWVVLRGTSLPRAMEEPRSTVLETWVDGERRYRHRARAFRTRAS